MTIKYNFKLCFTLLLIFVISTLSSSYLVREFTLKQFYVITQLNMYYFNPNQEIYTLNLAFVGKIGGNYSYFYRFEVEIADFNLLKDSISSNCGFI